MKRSLFLLLAGLCCAASAWADDRLRDVQTELKNQGFYYGETDGKPSDQLTAAVRRYQIRNGLEVTGQVSGELLQSLGIGGGAASPPTAQPEARPAPPSAPPEPTPAAPPRPPVNLRSDNSVAESDRRILREEANRDDTTPHAPGSLPPGVSNQPSEIYRGIFAHTPYEIAPKVVQEDTFRRAQRVLAERGFLRETPDDRPGPQTEEAVLSYQRSTGLPLTGRLDMQTLSVMRLLPHAGPDPGFSAGPGRVARPLPYKGIWVQ